MNQIEYVKGIVIQKYEFPKSIQPGRKHGPLTLSRALNPPLLRFSALKNRHINSVRNKMLWGSIISWKQLLELERIRHNEVLSSLLLPKFILKYHSSTFGNVSSSKVTWNAGSPAFCFSKFYLVFKAQCEPYSTPPGNSLWSPWSSIPCHSSKQRLHSKEMTNEGFN